MKVFKFGGASVKDADALKNVVNVLHATEARDLVIVVSAMGKTTNALEEVVAAHLNNSFGLGEKLQFVKVFHQNILEKSFKNDNPVFKKVGRLFEELEMFLTENTSTEGNYVYDQIVPYGELLSTTIVQAFFRASGIRSTWLDARNWLKTDDNHREAGVDWASTKEALNKAVTGTGIYLTQGFIASSDSGFMATLGREGSDYTAAIIAYCLNAESVTIWKDVAGVLSADPRHFKDARLLNSISYEEAIELAFYGASVIHPKTLQPLQRKGIPLYVRSFLNPLAEGTAVMAAAGIDPLMPCFIVKKGQALLSLSTLDFSFMMEGHIGEVFKLLGKNKIKVDVIQNSAISFKVCVEDKFARMPQLVEQLQETFKVGLVAGVELYTIRHFTQESIDFIASGREVLLKQVAGNTVQMVTR